MGGRVEGGGERGRERWMERDRAERVAIPIDPDHSETFDRVGVRSEWLWSLATDLVGW